MMTERDRKRDHLALWRLQVMTAKYFSNLLTHKAIGWGQNPRVLDQIGKLNFATANPFAPLARYHEVPVIEKNRCVDVSRMKQSRKRANRKFDFALREFAFDECHRIGGHHMKNDPRIALR